MMNRQALKEIEPGMKVGFVLPGKKQIEIVKVEKTTRVNIWLENGMVFNKKFGHRVRNTSDTSDFTAGHLVHPVTAAKMLNVYHADEKNWDKKTHNHEMRRLRKAAMDKATPVEWDKKTLPKTDQPQEKPAVPPVTNSRVTKLDPKEVKAANKAAKLTNENFGKTLEKIKAKVKKDKAKSVAKAQKADTKRATEKVDELHKALHKRQIFGSLYELNQDELQILETLISKLNGGKPAPVEKPIAEEEKPALRAVYGSWSLQTNHKSWAICKADGFLIRRNAYSGGVGAVVTYKTQAAAEKKIKTMLEKEVTNA